MNQASRTEETSRTEATTNFISFGVADAKGRIMGARVRTWEAEYVPFSPNENTPWRCGCYSEKRPVGTNFMLCVQATKDGNSWGSSQRDQSFPTAEARAAAIAARIKAGQKAAAKKAQA